MICFIPSKFLHPKGSELSPRETPVIFIILIESNASQRQKLSGNEVRTWISIEVPSAKTEFKPKTQQQNQSSGPVTNPQEHKVRFLAEFRAINKSHSNKTNKKNTLFPTLFHFLRLLEKGFLLLAPEIVWLMII